MLKLFDTHCHINDERFQSDRAEVIARMREAGIRRAVVVGDGARSPSDAFALARENDFLYAAAGRASARRVAVDGRASPADPRMDGHGQGGRAGRNRSGLPLRPLPPQRTEGGIRPAARSGLRARQARNSAHSRGARRHDGHPAGPRARRTHAARRPCTATPAAGKARRPI